MRCAARFRSVIAALLLVAVAAPPACAKVTVGEAVPAINLLNWEGQPINLRDLRGQVVVIDFWASWCTLCRQALPALDALNQRHAGAPIAVIGINIDRERTTAEHFLAD